MVPGLSFVLALMVELGGLSPAQADPGTLFVKLGGTGNACTQINPCALQTALLQAMGGDTIYVAGGTYTGTGSTVINITKSVTLYGGWDGATSGPVVRNPAPYPTALDGQKARRDISMTGPATVVLDGLTIANGRVLSTIISPTLGARWDGGDLYARDVALTLRRTHFYSNVVDAWGFTGSWAHGGDASVEGGILVVEEAVFQWNGARAVAQSFGGGLSLSGTLATTITNALFRDNDAWQSSDASFLGGSSGDRPPLVLLGNTSVDNGRRKSGASSGGYASAIRIDFAQAWVEGNTFRGGNVVNECGAVVVFNSHLLFARNLVYDNHGWPTSGLCLDSVSPFTLTNNIIAGNRSGPHAGFVAIRVKGGGGVFLHNTIARNIGPTGLVVDSATVALTNTILVSHTVGISVGVGSTATLQGTLWGVSTWANGTDWTGPGTILTETVNLRGNPAFVNPDSGDYHITAASAAQDTG
ncbi:MAG: right-handed parallel beta-helix repeat-containing protein [Anaerolineae bacterium]|nr:right-handed parallel beta-helix repeat-containing protein [Anaerolineae bacterium]